VYLTLTLGQSSLFLLMAALMVGKALRHQEVRACVIAAFALIPAVAAKLFPLVWLAALPWLRRWRLFIVSTVLILVVLGGSIVALPTVNRSYWCQVLPERMASLAQHPEIDDQSLTAWLVRLARPQTYRVTGLSTMRTHIVVWSSGWSLDPKVVRWAGYAFTIVLALVPLAVFFKVGTCEREGAFYLWVLYSLLVFPHMARYNHVLILPAMAWLWGRGRQAQDLVVTVYFFAGLSRMNHLWAILLPAPWGPFASGLGLLAVCLLAGGLVAYLWPSESES
jgi:alpha-1,2-mannosyltransferase